LPHNKILCFQSLKTGGFILGLGSRFALPPHGLALTGE
jgi:hypothetical protein